MLERFADDVWTIPHPLKLGGVQFGTRATVVRLGDGTLWMAAPVPLDDATKAELAGLGSMSAIVAPNKLHYFYFAEAAKAYPDATLWLAPGLAEKRKELPAARVLGPDQTWKPDLESTFIEGWRFADETVFFHPRSRTLILTDLVFNLRAPRGVMERTMLKAMGAYDRFGPSRLAKMTMRDRPAVRRSVDRILEWEFEGVITTHGDNVDKGGRELLRGAFSQL